MRMKPCECGCGMEAPRRFVSGHNVPKGPLNPRWRGGKKTRGLGGYVAVMDPSHPRADQQGYVREHVVIAERAVGHVLPAAAVVHHVNSDPSDNRPSNLVVCQSQGYHLLLHRRLNALRACGNANWLICNYCHQYDAPERLTIRPANRSQHGSSQHHARCRAAYVRDRRAARRDVA